jgi:hypothetical protein
VFRLDEADIRLMPDLSAAVVFQVPDSMPAGAEPSAVIAAAAGAAP